MSAGHNHAAEVLNQLSGDQNTFQALLLALKNMEEAQHLLAAGDSSGTITASQKAESTLARIPQARFLLGICKADLAAAYGNLGSWREAASNAREAIALSSADSRFKFTQASANMTLGNALYSSGLSDEGAQHFAEARRLFGSLPGGEQHIAVVDHNESQLRGGPKGLTKRWWKFWK